MGGTRVKHKRTRAHDERFYVYTDGGVVWDGGERSRTKPKWNEGKRKGVEEERGEVETGVGGGGWWWWWW